MIYSTYLNHFEAFGGDVWNIPGAHERRDFFFRSIFEDVYLGEWAPRMDRKWLVLATPMYFPFISNKKAIWKGSHNTILRGRKRSPWLLTTYPPSRGFVEILRN